MPTKIFRYNISGFVEELLPLPEQTHGHTCAVLPSTGVRLDLDQPLKPLQAFIVVGGENRESGMHSRVVTLFPGGCAWTYLARLPQGLWQPRLSLVSGRMTLIGGSIGGFDGGLVKSEVIINKWCKINLTNKYTFPGRYLSTILSHGTSG